MKHGHAVGGKETRIYRIWAAMKQRCNNPLRAGWDQYGGRCISVCPRWDKFANFLADMGPTYQEGLTIDRIDNDGNYEPSNCRWATYAEQNKNKRAWGTSE